MRKEPRKVGLIDMDDTLFNHDKKLKEDYNLIKSPTDPELDIYEKNRPLYIKRRVNLIRNQPGWWRNLEPMKLGFDILRVTQELGLYVKIATKGPGSASNAWSEKKDCIEDHIGLVGIDVGLSVSEDKSDIHGRFLADDSGEFLENWLEYRPRGIGIMPINDHNKDFYNERVLRYDGSNSDELRRAITWARDRIGPMPKFK